MKVCVCIKTAHSAKTCHTPSTANLKKDSEIKKEVNTVTILTLRTIAASVLEQNSQTIDHKFGRKVPNVVRIQTRNGIASKSITDKFASKIEVVTHQLYVVYAITPTERKARDDSGKGILTPLSKSNTCETKRVQKLFPSTGVPLLERTPTTKQNTSKKSRRVDDHKVKIENPIHNTRPTLKTKRYSRR